MSGWSVRERLGAMVAPAVLVLLTAACGSDASEGTPVATFEGLDGAALYEQACSRCHGVDLRGTDQGPPFLDAIYRPGHHADAAFFLAAKNGARAHHRNFGNMPPVSGLSDEQIEAIVGHVRAQQRAAGIE
jgi:mono/diheme cytochrome c family protein